MNITKNIEADIILVVHRIWFDGKRKTGGLDKVTAFLANEKNKKILLIEHPLYNFGPSRVSLYSKDGIKEIGQENTRGRLKFISWIREIIFNLEIMKKCPGAKIFAAGDPLSAFPATLGISGHNFRKKYYHSVDYSNKRFRNFVFNWIYFLMLRRALKKFDIISVVSRKTREKFINFGCPKRKIFFNPNSPVFRHIEIPERNEPAVISTGGSVISKYRYGDVVEIAVRVKKEFTDVKFYIVGNLDEDKEYVDALKGKIKNKGLEDNFIFTGFLPAEGPELESYFKKSKVGLAFYSQEAGDYIYFGDSLKIREYALYGIPTITDGKIAPYKELAEGEIGFMIDTNQEAVEKILFLLKNKEAFQKTSDNCIKWAKENDKAKILERLYQKIYN